MYQKDNNFKMILVFLITFLVILIFAGIYAYLSRPLEIKFIPISFGVGDNIGISKNLSELDFGVVPPGMSVSRKILLGNNRDFDVFVVVILDSNLSDYLFGNDTVFLLAGESKEYVLQLSVPINISHGDYSGKIGFLTKKAKFL